MKKTSPSRRASKLGMKSRRKGVKGEQAWVHRLNKLLPSHAPFARDWLHSRQKQSRGDLVSTRESLISDFYIEVKVRNSVTNENIRRWWKEAMENAKRLVRYHILLCVHQSAGPWLVFTEAKKGCVLKWTKDKSRKLKEWNPDTADVIIVPMM